MGKVDDGCNCEKKFVGNNWLKESKDSGIFLNNQTKEKAYGSLPLSNIEEKAMELIYAQSLLLTINPLCISTMSHKMIWIWLFSLSVILILLSFPHTITHLLTTYMWILAIFPYMIAYSTDLNT